MHVEHERIIVISGGSGFVGSAISLELITKGWKVVSLALSKKEIPGIDVYECDICDASSVRQAIAEITAKGKLYACIHAAASPAVRKPLLSLSTGEFRADIDIALIGAFNLAKETLQHMQTNGAFIGITTASLEDKVPTKSVGSYIPAKAGLRGFLRTLAQEIQSDNLRVNAIAPGFIPNGLNRDLPEAIRSFIAKKVDPENSTLRQIVETVSAICDNDPAFPTGTSILLPGKIVTSL